MLNLSELEAMWLRYKIKSYIPHIVIFFSTVIILSIVFSIDFNNENEKNIAKKSPISSIKNEDMQNEFTNEAIKNEKAINQNPSVNYANDSTKMIMSPNLDFIKSMHKNSPMYYDSQDTKGNNYIPESINVNKMESTKEESIKKSEPAIEVEELETEIVKENTIDIKRQTTEEDIQLVIERFKKSNNPALSLFIAKKYYELGNYNQSYNYALITNELNNNIEDSWIIFAKSLLKLNKKQKAIQILQEYINHSHSSRAQQLLNNIKSGKIK